MMKYRRKIRKPINKNIKRYNRVKVITDLIAALIFIWLVGYCIYYTIWRIWFYPDLLHVWPLIDIRIMIWSAMWSLPILIIIYEYRKLWDARIYSILEKREMRKGKV